MTYTYNFPVSIDSSGPRPTDPNTLRTEITAYAQAESPGISTDLPGTLIEDIASTEVGGAVVIDQARVDTLNGCSPNAANLFLLALLAQQYGIAPQGMPTNTSVGVVFSGTVNYVVPNGFLVADGSGNTYQVQGGGVIGSGGSSLPMTAVALNPVATAPAAGTVTTLVTSYPSNVTLSVTNPSAGQPATAAESNQMFQARVQSAGLSAGVGFSRYIKTQLSNLPGIPANLISVQAASGGLRIVVGGTADVYQIAYAIYVSVGNYATLQGSAVSNTRNVTVDLFDAPDTIPILYVSSPAQTVTATATWNTTQTNFTGGSSFASLVQGPISGYIASLGVGQPINLLELNNLFQTAVSSVLDPALLTRLVWSIYINGTLVNPGSGESYVSGDPESYFTCQPSAITVVQA